MSGWGIVTYYCNSASGKIWGCWRLSLGALRCINVDKQCVTIEVTKNNGAMFIVTIEYMRTDTILRRCLWNKMVNLSSHFDLPWMVLEISNSILNSQETVGGAEIRHYHFAYFLDCITIVGLTDMRYM